jgi:hypothetical protein
MSIILSDPDLLRLLFIFWLPAHIIHLVAFILANIDDIFLDWKRFFLGDIAGWGLLCGMTMLWVFGLDISIWWLYGYYIFHILVVSTLFTDLALYQETVSVSNIKMIFVETLFESILIPWISGILIGGIVALIFWP